MRADFRVFFFWNMITFIRGPWFLYVSATIASCSNISWVSFYFSLISFFLSFECSILLYLKLFFDTPKDLGEVVGLRRISTAIIGTG